MDKNFKSWFKNLKQIASAEYGYDFNSLYFEPEAACIWEPYFYAGKSEHEAIEEELGE